MPVNLNNKKVDIKAAAQKALKDKDFLAELLENLWSKNETLRYNSHKVLFHITEQKPQALYSKWDYFVKFLDSDNTYHKLSAVLLLANLTCVDKDNKFEKIFNKYYSLLDDKSFITAAYICEASGKIARAKPKLQTKITNKLLSIDKTHYRNA
jgi:predicted AlkP superfamily phosphohydrolase/phosphomutase